jgi:hypothetical protein
VEFEPDSESSPEPDRQMDEFERELKQAFARRPAPPGLKRRLMERRRFAPRAQRSFIPWQRLAAGLVLAAALAGGIQWHMLEQRRKEEAAREQVFMALRITSHALNQMNARLAAHRRGEQN